VSWAALWHSHTTTIALIRLGRSDGAMLVDRFAGGKSLPTEVTDQIVTRADGVPLLLEELTPAGHFKLPRVGSVKLLHPQGRTEVDC